MRLNSKRNSLIVACLLIAASILFMKGIGGAEAIRGNATVAKGQTVNSSLYASGTNIKVAGTVNGDVFCFGQTVTITGTVHGDVICAARDLTIGGTVDGNVRAVGQTVQLSGSVGRSATLAAQDLTLSSSAKIGLDAQEASPNATINGTIGRDLSVGGALATVNASVGRDFNGSLNQLTFGSKTTIAGQANYASDSQAKVDKAAHFAHTINYHQPTPHTGHQLLFIFRFGGFLYVAIALTLVALVLVLLLPDLFEVTQRAGHGFAWRTSTYGLLGLFGIPFVAAIFVVTVVGIPLAILVAVAWILGLFLTGPVVAYQIGNWVLARFNRQQALLAMFIGTLITLLLYATPGLGFVALVGVGVYGYGALLLAYVDRNREGQPKPKRFAKKVRKA